jgi:hypothetical protein
LVLRSHPLGVHSPMARGAVVARSSYNSVEFSRMCYMQCYISQWKRPKSAIVRNGNDINVKDDRGGIDAL